MGGTKGKTWEEIHGIEGAARMRAGVKIWTKTRAAKKKCKETRKKKFEEKGMQHKKECLCFICKATRGETTGKNNSFYGCGHTDESKKLMGRRGSDHPNWQGGIAGGSYPFDFNDELKKLIRERDNHTCQLCDKTQEEEGKNLSVHHIDYVKENINPDNLITLCRSCNIKVNYGRDAWKKFFEKKLKFIS